MSSNPTHASFDTALCDKLCQWLEAGRWFFQGTPVSSTNETDRHDKTEILLNVALNTITRLPTCIWCIVYFVMTIQNVAELFLVDYQDCI